MYCFPATRRDPHNDRSLVYWTTDMRLPNMPWLCMCAIVALTSPFITAVARLQLYPSPTLSGYLPVGEGNSSLYYAYYEAQQSAGAVEDVPILLWLQGGPGCASTFGAFYELGPFWVQQDLSITPNNGSWNRAFGLLIIDQPVGVGYSNLPGSSEATPVDMLGVSSHLYAALLAFFDRHPQHQQRPFFITGESYGGKYIPSIAHYVLEADQLAAAQDRRGDPSPSRHLAPGFKAAGHSIRASSFPKDSSSSSSRRWHRCSPATCRECRPLTARRLSGQQLRGPNFHLAGIAIGNGLTDPVTQLLQLSVVAGALGLVSDADLSDLEQQQRVIAQLVEEEEWQAATDNRVKLIEYLEQAAGVATLFDVRRDKAYDAEEFVQRYLDQADVKAALGAAPEVKYTSCSDAVMAVLAADVMKSVVPLVVDLLQQELPVLLYQGQFDVQDGVASTEAWLAAMHWEYDREWQRQEGELWRTRAGVPGGWRRSIASLTQMVIRNAGHMVPHDQPLHAQEMIEQWVDSTLKPRPSSRRRCCCRTAGTAAATAA